MELSLCHDRKVARAREYHPSLKTVGVLYEVIRFLLDSGKQDPLKVNHFENRAALHNLSITSKRFAKIGHDEFKKLLDPEFEDDENCISAFSRDPEKRKRSYTACDEVGRKYLKGREPRSVGLCLPHVGLRVHFTGIRQGQGQNVQTILEENKPESVFFLTLGIRFKTVFMNFFRVKHMPLEWTVFEYMGRRLDEEHSLWTLGVVDKFLRVDAYLTCAEDERFVRVRDFREVYEQYDWLFKMKVGDPYETIIDKVRAQIGDGNWQFIHIVEDIRPLHKTIHIIELRRL